MEVTSTLPSPALVMTGDVCSTYGGEGTDGCEATRTSSLMRIESSVWRRGRDRLVSNLVTLDHEMGTPAFESGLLGTSSATCPLRR